MTLFNGFDDRVFDTGEARIAYVCAGDGPPLVLLHGFPQTRASWHLVAPALARDFTVVVPDLRGYGRSTGPEPWADGANYSKRAMGEDVLALMRGLGHERFMLAGHDRGARVGYRLALDHPQAVESLALLDILTTLDTWEAFDWRQGLRAYHWPFLAQPAGFVETMIGADPAFYLDHLLHRWQGRGVHLDTRALADYHAAIAKPQVIAAMAADYRAGAAVDTELDRADRTAGNRLQCPLLLLRGSQYESRPLAPGWATWAEDMTETVFDSGHFIAEEQPEATIRALRAHFGPV